jgi:hypothetical protein
VKSCEPAELVGRWITSAGAGGAGGGGLEFQGKRRTWGKKLGGKEGAENIVNLWTVWAARVYSVHGHNAFW